MRYATRYRDTIVLTFMCRLLAVLSVLIGSAAAALDAPNERVMLTVDGHISTTNSGEQALFDRAMLANLDWRTIETYTSFTEGLNRFSGPTIASLLEAVGAQGAKLRAVAADDYAVTISIADAKKHGAILAMEHNGQQMGIRNKGPIWIVYPQSKAEAEAHTYYVQMIWQLVRIEVLAQAG